MKHKATALISCYNANEFMKHKISNLNQLETDIEIIIVDCNGGKNVIDLEIQSNMKVIVNNDRISLWRAINQAISMSNCEYIFQSNCDDLISPDSIEKQIKCLDEGADICYFDYYITDGYFKTWSDAVTNHYTSYNTPDNGYSTGFGLGMFPMWKKSLHNDVGLFDERLEIYGDSLFWHKLKESNKKFKRIPECLGVYAQRNGHNLESNQEFADNDIKILSTG